MFSWFKKKQAVNKPAPGVSTLAKMDLPQKSGPRRTDTGGEEERQAATSDREGRAARREVLFAIVRESMVKAGVLSSCYRFKVLSLDPRGRQFIIMMDLSREYAGEPDRMDEIESHIAQRAITRYDILVKAVYWRFAGFEGMSDAGTGVAASQPGAFDAMPVAPAPAARGRAAAAAPAATQGQQHATPRAAPRFDPLGEDEVDAFRHALHAGKGFPPSIPPPTEFPATEIPRDHEDRRGHGLSRTQYGDLN